MRTNRYLDLKGATCASCAYTIERTGRRLDGVEDVHVDAAAAKVEVTFTDNEADAQTEVLEKIQRVIQLLGYDADITES
jgi:copper chaperone CopZ